MAYLHTLCQLYFGFANAKDSRTPLNNIGLSRKHIVEGTALLLKRLDLPYVDIVFAHRPDRQTPMEQIVRGFNHLIHTGRAFYWGTSEWSASEIADAWRIADRLGLVGPVVEQSQYNLLERERVEREYRWLYDAPHRLGLTVFAPAKMGILTEKYNMDDMTAPLPGSRMAEAAAAGDKIKNDISRASRSPSETRPGGKDWPSWRN